MHTLAINRVRVLGSGLHNPGHIFSGSTPQATRGGGGGGGLPLANSRVPTCGVLMIGEESIDGFSLTEVLHENTSNKGCAMQMFIVSVLTLF